MWVLGSYQDSLASADVARFGRAFFNVNVNGQQSQSSAQPTQPTQQSNSFVEPQTKWALMHDAQERLQFWGSEVAPSPSTLQQAQASTVVREPIG